MANEDDGERSVPYFFPDDQPIRFTLQIFPDSALVKDAAGAPWAACLSPYVEADSVDEHGERAPPPVPIDRVARCEECFAYICPFSVVTSRYWKCALCGQRNRVTQELSRYRKRNAFQTLPELSQETVEFELPLDSKGAMMRSGEIGTKTPSMVLLETGYLAQEPAASRPVVYLAVIDECGGPEYHDVMAKVLSACVSGLPDDCRFGVVTVSDRIGLVDLAAPFPHVQFIDMGFDCAFGGVDAGAGAAVGGTGSRDGWPNLSGIVSLSDVMSLEELVCPVGENRDRILGNVERLRGACRGAHKADADAAPGPETRATGLAVKLLLDLILGGGSVMAPASAVSANPPTTRTGPWRAGRSNGLEGNMPPAVDPRGKGKRFTFAGCRLMLFLSGAPNVGPGAVNAVSVPPLEEGHAHDQMFRGELRALGFYRGQAYRAASSGVSVDVHCFANNASAHFGLSSMAPLAMTTGGGVYRHSLLHQRDGEDRGDALGKQVCAELLRPRVYDGLLRVRTSAEFSVNRDGVYGNLSADPRLENLWHVASCSSGQSFAMDFEFQGGGRGGGGGAESWDDDADAGSIVQSAFAYTAVVPVNDVHNGEQSIFANGRSRGGEHNDAGRMVTVRRLRVTTVKTEASSSVKEVSSMADPYAVAAVLTHKVVSEARRSGFAEARALLRDWLTNFVYGLSQNLGPPIGVGEENVEEKMGKLMTNPLVVSVARLVFGLLQSPLLHPTEGLPDERVSLLSRLSTLDADSLSLVLYPDMQGYANRNVRLANNLSLSREAVSEASSTCRIFVVDTFWKVVIHYSDLVAATSDRGNGALPIPPDDDSSIGQFLELRRVVRPMAGQEIVYSSSGAPEAFFFQEALIEDRALPRSEGGHTFKDFLSNLLRDVVRD